MRHALLVSALLFCALLLPDPQGPTRARADDAEFPGRLRDAQRREGELQHQLQAAQVWADTNENRAQHLIRLAEDVLKQLAEARTATAPLVATLEDQIATLHAQIATLQTSLRAEQQRHVKDAQALQRELAKALARVETGRLSLVRAHDAVTVAEVQLRVRSQEVERLRWIYGRRTPRDSVARVLTNIPATHWRTELKSGDAVRARVALQVLGVLPDPSLEAIEAILAAAGRHGSLLDAALRPLVRIGKPAVPPLVAAGCGEDAARKLDRGWVMHVLGSLGPEARDALPWLEELAAGTGREAGQAQRAIERIRTP